MAPNPSYIAFMSRCDLGVWTSHLILRSTHSEIGRRVSPHNNDASNARYMVPVTWHNSCRFDAKYEVDGERFTECVEQM